jgi:1-aminocyclopropane-1-carboxylate deaminase/D-cysteine desulfhydrase-like pyridoxal-dependent ACC family enzyme
MDELNKLTPVEKCGDMWFKRDDYYKPFEDFGVCGGKVRQCISLVRENKKYIEEECDGTLATASSVHSPQAAIVSRVAKAAGYKSFIGIGNTTVEKALKHRAIQVADSLGSEIVILSDTQAFNSVLYYQLTKLKEERSFFEIQFGFQARTQRVSIIDTIAKQVENIPEEVTALVVPVGSGITFCGIFSTCFAIVSIIDTLCVLA